MTAENKQERKEKMTPYTEVITQSKSWSCPESGTYKVICVGSGGDGTTDGKVGDMGQIDMKHITLQKGVSVSCTISSDTSFGSYITCSKGASISLAMAPNGLSLSTGLFVGGVGGYTLDGTFGGDGAIFAYSGSNASIMTSISPIKNGGMPGSTGLGYGAGGGFTENNMNKSVTMGRSGVIVIQRVE